MNRVKHPGQSVLLITVIVCIIVVITIGMSISLFNQQGTQRNLTGKRVTESYYIAMQGVQEALGTRMIPRSNHLNFRNELTPGHGTKFFDGTTTVLARPFYAISGRVFETPLNVAYDPALGAAVNPLLEAVQPAGLIGVYRYVIVGGDGNIDRNTNTYIPNTENQTNHLPTSSPFYIISSGFTCNLPGGVPIAGALQVGTFPAKPKPTCGIVSNAQTANKPVQTVMDETVVVARAMVDQPRMLNPTTPDLQGNLIPDELLSVTAFRGEDAACAYNGQPQICVDLREGRNANGGAFVPGVGFVRTERFNFETMWNVRPGNPQFPAKLRRVSIYDNVTNEVLGVADDLNLSPNNFKSITCKGTGCFGGAFPSSVTIRLHFLGPVDFRSLYKYNIAGCVDDEVKCNIQLASLSPTSTRQFNFVPVFPATTSAIVTPSFIPGKQHQLVVRALTSYNGDPDPNWYGVTFRVKG